MTQKQNHEETIKKLDHKIQQVKSDIEKHKETLNGLNSNRTFLLKLSPPQFLENRDKVIDAKYSELKSSWIKRHKEDPDLDYDIIFKDDEDIHDGIKMQFTFLTQPNFQAQDGRIKKQTNEWRRIHKEIPNEEWEIRFQ